MRGITKQSFPRLVRLVRRRDTNAGVLPVEGGTAIQSAHLAERRTDLKPEVADALDKAEICRGDGIRDALSVILQKGIL